MTAVSDAADVPVICGPTAAGKSAVALWLAGRDPAERVTIVSADSRQVYRGFDVGTAKPTDDERARVPHAAIDIVDPTTRYSAAAWAEAADGWIAEARRDGRVPLIVGGTGLYLRALFEGLFVEPPLDRDRRAALAALLDSMPTDVVRRWVAAIDPPRAPLGRTQLVRALEVALLTGRRLSDLHGSAARPARWRPQYLVVDPGPALAMRIAARVDAMLHAGWAAEVIRLMQTIPDDAPAWQATGYDMVRRLVRGEETRAAAREAIVVATRQYAKRQRTWFRHQLPVDRVTRVDPLANDWRERVAAWWHGVVGVAA